MTQSFGETFWEIICSAEYAIRFLFLVSGTLLLLGVLAWPLIEPGSPERLMLIIDFILMGFMLLLAVGLMYRCRQRQPKVNTRDRS
jgi:hypothetical protein